jgi:hypothetical protein
MDKGTKTASDEMLQDKIYSTLDGDINISKIIHGVTNLTPLNVNFNKSALTKACFIIIIYY